MEKSCMNDSFVDPLCIPLTLGPVTALEDDSTGTFNRKSKELVGNGTSGSVVPFQLRIPLLFVSKIGRTSFYDRFMIVLRPADFWFIEKLCRSIMKRSKL